MFARYFSVRFLSFAADSAEKCATWKINRVYSVVNAFAIAKKADRGAYKARIVRRPLPGTAWPSRSIMAKCAPSYDLTEVTVLTAGRRYRTISARWSFSCSSSPPAATAGNRLVRNMRGGCTGWPGFSAFAMARPRWAGIVDTCAFSAAW